MDEVIKSHMISEDGVYEIRMGTVPGPQTALSGELPLELGHVQMAFPPPGGELVQADVSKDGEITGYYRIRAEQCDVTEEEDLWAQSGDVIPGEFQFELRIGDDFCTRDGLDWIMELKDRSPAQFARIALTIADVLQVQPDHPANLN